MHGAYDLIFMYSIKLMSVPYAFISSYFLKIKYDLKYFKTKNKSSSMGFPFMLTLCRFCEATAYSTVHTGCTLPYDHPSNE